MSKNKARILFLQGKNEEQKKEQDEVTNREERGQIQREKYEGEKRVS